MRDLHERPLLKSLRKVVYDANADIGGLDRAAKTVAGRPGEIADLLASCLASTSEWARIASQSYLHPNGFTKFVLYDPADSLYRLRLHVWTGEAWQRDLQDEQNIHGHRWDFGSAIIAGPGLHIDEYVQCESGGTPYRSYQYQPRAGEPRGAEFAVEGDELVPAGQVLLEHAVRYSLAAGDSYSCDTERLHTVRSTSAELTATLIVQGQCVIPQAPVFRRHDQPVQAAPTAMTDAQARRIMIAAIGAIRQHAGEC